MTVKQRLEREEESRLSRFAALSSKTKGRERPTTLDNIRTEFQRDRDRIIHSKSFRRLKYKTQMVISPGGDHIRTRLTHTLEVAQVARTIARALSLNEDLTEAIALGHDLGHTPFGHMGERTLDRLVGFKHNEQSLRQVELLENDGEGLNLTYETRQDILRHTGENTPITLEGWCVKLSDRIAYVNHDIDDAVSVGMLRADELPKQCVDALGTTRGERIATLVEAVVTESDGQPFVRMPKEILDALTELRAFLNETVYRAPWSFVEEEKTDHVISKIYEKMVSDPTLLPPFFQTRLEIDGAARCACDFIAGMTDRFVMRTFNDLFIPRSSDE